MCADVQCDGVSSRDVAPGDIGVINEVFRRLREQTILERMMEIYDRASIQTGWNSQLVFYVPYKIRRELLSEFEADRLYSSNIQGPYCLVFCGIPIRWTDRDEIYLQEGG